MNYRMIGRINALILYVEAIFMIPATLICVGDGDMAAAYSFVYTIAITGSFASILLLICRKAKKGFYAREGLVSVGMSWVALSLFGCLPFIFSGAIPNFIDALFEIVSGFTTTGASILTDIEVLPRGMLYWRSFSHWLGGMGVLVFLLALVPISGRDDGYTMHLMRAESPGPDVGKLVPRMKQTALILYIIYIALTILNVVFLLIGDMPFFDAICTAFGTAGTGGFAIKNSSLTEYSGYLQNVCTVFMFLFGINFTCYYLLLCKRVKNVLKDEELRLYVGVAIVSVLLIAFNIRNMHPSFGDALHQSSFQVSSIMTTTGFASTDFDKWPVFSKAILLCLMAIGACAGSTGGGIKCGRALLILKALRRNIRQVLYPNKVQVVRMNGRVISESVLRNANAYLAAYVLIALISFVIISTDGFSIATNLSAIFACFNNIGPGFDSVGPMANYSLFSVHSKLVLIFDMLAGRLEIFPILVLFSRSAWKRS